MHIKTQGKHKACEASDEEEKRSLKKNETHAKEDHQKAISPGPGKESVSDEIAGRCLHPEGNGVNPEGGMGEGPVLQAGSKMSSSSAAGEGNNTSTEQPGRWKKSSA